MAPHSQMTVYLVLEPHQLLQIVSIEKAQTAGFKINFKKTLLLNHPYLWGAKENGYYEPYFTDQI